MQSIHPGAQMLLSFQHQPYTVPTGKRSWHVNSSGLDMNLKPGSVYILVNAGKEDFEKARNFYLRNPVNGYDIRSVEIIHNPTLSASFQSGAESLNQRAGNPAFKPKWREQKDNLELRIKVYELYESKTEPYKDDLFPSVKFLPMWHGTKPECVDSICKTGFANLALTDSGYFGKGIYSSYDAEYSWRVYAKGGVLVLVWNACFSAYPVVDGDIQNLKGKANYANHDAHFIPVVPLDPKNPNEVSYIPCKKGQTPRYIELVVFEKAHCLPRYLVTLQPNLTKPIQALPAVNTFSNTSNMVAQYEKAKALYAQRNYEAAFAEYKTLAVAGFDKAQYMTGVCYYYGKGTECDYDRAHKYLNLSANQNNANAYYTLGMFYYEGKSAPRDLGRSKNYFTESAKLGSADAKKALETLFKT